RGRRQGQAGPRARGVPRCAAHPRRGRQPSYSPPQATQAGGAGGIEQREAPIHVSNVALVDPEDNKPTKVGYRLEEIELDNGRTKQVRVRYAKRSGKDI